MREWSLVRKNCTLQFSTYFFTWDQSLFGNIAVDGTPYTYYKNIKYNILLNEYSHLADLSRRTRGIVACSGRLGGKPFMDLPYSLSVTNIGKQ